jgi:hypothetical protein
MKNCSLKLQTNRETKNPGFEDLNKPELGSQLFHVILLPIQLWINFIISEY